MTLANTQDRRVRDVWRQLDRVTDPELDEPITEMGFVERVTLVEANRVEVAFRLPTYWCSPNFAFLMADGIRREVEDLPWVSRVTVRLEDHLCAEELNDGVNAGRGFSEVFSEISDGDDLEEIRLKFLEKAFQRRQEAVLLALCARGLGHGEIAAMPLGVFDGIAFEHGDAAGEAENEAAKQKPRYRALLIERNLARDPHDPAFRTFAGQTLQGRDLAAYLAELRGVRINMEFNGALCRGLGKARYRQADLSKDEPTLIDFILDRVPAADMQKT